MDRISTWLVNRHKLVLAMMGIFCAVSIAAAGRVKINADMTKYLPSDSNMKQGLTILSEEFADVTIPSTIRVMFTDLGEEKKEDIRKQLENLPSVDSVTSQESADGGYTLFTLSIPFAYGSEEELAVEDALKSGFGDDKMLWKNDNAYTMDIPPLIFAVAAIILTAVLFALCGSWAEPFLFLTAIGMAILINMGTNLLLGTVSQITYSISAILQLVLSMDYSIILMNRYRQERETLEKKDAMRAALVHSFSSVAASGFTTVVGLFMLVFMRFRIGLDLGLVLAKGVLLSMICVLTVLPALILIFDGAIARTGKKVLKVPVSGLARFSWRFRFFLTAGFFVLFIGSYFLQRQADIAYTLSQDDPIAEVFPQDNPVILVYGQEDVQAANRLASQLAQQEQVTSVQNYGLLFMAMDRLQANQGHEHYLMQISTTLPLESDQTAAFIRDLQKKAREQFDAPVYLIGNSVMSEEMAGSFQRELLVITLLTASSIFLVVAITFRQLLIPFLLVCLVQCGVYITVATTWLIGYDMYYLALLVVQCILMGATVDYGILFTNYYREKRRTEDAPRALMLSYQGAVHTILTSALFMIFGTGAIGFSPVDPTIGQICQSISLGALATTALVLLVLPGMLSALDGAVTGRRRRKRSGGKGSPKAQ